MQRASSSTGSNSDEFPGSSYPIQIINFVLVPKKPSKLMLNKIELKKLLDSVGNRPIFLISIAGASRQGKSFFLTILLNMLSKFEHGNPDGWRDLLTQTSLRGFEFQNGIDRQTVGFWMWSKPFILKRTDGSEIAVLVMDTQGVFDSTTTKRDWSMIVGLSLLTSSCLIYNVHENILEDKLDIFNNFVEFGMLTLQQDGEVLHPFQRLIFLVRDWNMPQSCQYGSQGGKQFLQQRLKVTPEMAEELQTVRRTLVTCFESVECCLLPHPGEPAKRNDYKGNLKVLDQEFLKNVKSFVEDLLDADTMKVKISNGRGITGSELFVYFDKYVQAFNQIILPKPKTLLQVTIEARLHSIVEGIMASCQKQLDGLVKPQDFFGKDELNQIFKKLHGKAQEDYNQQSKLVNSVKEKKNNWGMLSTELKSSYHKLVEVNETKRKDLQKKASEMALKVYRKHLEDSMRTMALLPEQFTKVKKEAREMAVKEINSVCGKRDDLFYQDLRDIMNKEMEDITNQMGKFNDQNLQVEEQSCKQLVGSLTGEYRQLIGIAELGGQLTREKLEEVHRRCESSVMSKLQDQLRSSNELRRKMTVDELQNKILEIMSEMAMKIAGDQERLDATAEQMVSVVVGEFKATLQQFLKSNSSLGDIRNQHGIQKGLFFQKLMPLYLNHAGKAAQYVDKASREMDQVLVDIEREMEKKRVQDQNQMEEIVRHVSTEFFNALRNFTSNRDFNFDEDFNKLCQKMKKQALNLEAHMGWTQDKSLHKKFQEMVSASVTSVVEEIRVALQMKMDEDLMFLSHELEDVVQNHKKFLLHLLQKEDVKDLRAFQQSNDREVQTYREHFKPEAYPHLRGKQVTKLFNSMDSDLEKTFIHFKTKFEEKLQKIKTEIDETEAGVLRRYEYEMKFKCGEMSRLTLEQLEASHAMCQDKCKHDFLTMGGASMDPQEQRRFLDQVLQKMQNHFEQLKKQWGQERKTVEGRIEQMHKSACMDLEQDATREMPVSKSLGDFTEFLRNKAYALTDSFESDFPIGSVQERSGHRNKLKIALGEIQNRVLQEFNNNTEQVGKKVAAEVAKIMKISDHEFQEIQYSEGRRTYLTPQELHQHHVRILARCLEEVDRAVDLNDEQKHSLRLKVEDMLNSRIYTLTEENKRGQQEVLEQSITQRAQANKAFEEKLEKVTDHEQADKLLDEELKNVEVEAGSLPVSAHIQDQMAKKVVEELKDVLSKWRKTTPQGAELELAIIKSKEIYHQQMKSFMETEGYIHPKELEEKHRNALQVVRKNLSSLKIPVNSPIVNSNIEKVMKLAFRQYEDLNDMRHVDPKEVAIGIDLGTTYSCVAIYRNNAVEMIPERNTHKFITPSYVLYKDNEIIVGQVAKDQAVIYPDKAVFDAKRLIGRKFDDKLTQEDAKLWPFKIIDSNNRPKIEVDNESYFPEQVSAEVLKKLKADAELYLNCTIKNAVITVPAYFSDSQKKATKDAGAVAKLNVLGILNEPTSAAVAYSLSYTDDVERNVLVYDLGGGTFDVSVLTIKQGDISVKAVGGDNHLGGEDFDNNMLNYCIDQFITQHNVDLRVGNLNMVNGNLRRIRHCCEKEKINLSVASTVRVILPNVSGDINLDIEITRQKFNEMNDSQFKVTIDVVRKALEEAKLAKEQIDDIVLVGGSSRIPKIQELLQEFFPGKYLNMDINPDEVVARGAAIFAAMKGGSKARALNKIQFEDVAPLSLGIELKDKSFSTIIPKNSKVPVTRTESYTTAFNNQTSVNILVFEGEDPIAKNNNLLGEFIVNGIPGGPAGREKIDVTIHCTEEGLLKVSAVIKSTGGSKSVEIESKTTNMTAEELKELIGEID